MNETRIRLRDGHGDVFDELVIDHRADIGAQIRRETEPLIDAGRSVPIDVEAPHCPSCDSDVADHIGLSLDEVYRIRRWRDAAKMTPLQRAAEHLTAAELGAILDKIVAMLDTSAGETCNRDDTHRIVVEVEPEPW